MSSAGRPTQAELEIRKKRVVEVATRLFVQQGYAETSLVEIANIAGVGTRTVYQHFGDKEMLFREVIFARNMNPFDVDLTHQPGETLEQLLMRGARFACDAALRETSAGLMRLIIAESARFPALTKKVIDRTNAKLYGHLATMFESAAAAKLIGADDHALSARIFVDVVLGVKPLPHYTGWETELPTDEELAFKVQFFIRGRLTR